MQKLADAARGGLIAYGTVFNTLEEQAKTLGTAVKTQSVTVVQHRYGTEAGAVYGDAVTAAGNAAMTYLNVQSLGVKGLVKKTAKETGKSVVKKTIDAHAGPNNGS
jgi:spartin